MMNFKKNIKNLGTVNGKLLFFGGVYGNLQALEALQNWTDKNGYTGDNIFCTGDILGYCAQPLECIQLIREWGIHSIAGNVELQIRNDEDDCGCDFKSEGRCDIFSKNWYAFTKSKIDEDVKQWLSSLPDHIQFNYGQKKLTLVHGSWFHISAFIFKSTPWNIKQETFAASGSDIVVAGHCGLPFADINENNIWFNAGVIGMPANEGCDRVWFLTLEQEANNIIYNFRHYQYDNKKASDMMRKNELPMPYAETLLTGIWDNCEILPEQETSQQGKMISF